MIFQSILGINKPEQIDPEKIEMPKFFYDLNLDQIIKDIMDEQKLYDLRRFYYYKVQEQDIRYRIEVLKDLEQESLYQGIVDFAIGMRKAKEYLNNIQETDHKLQKKKWKLDAAYYYINCVNRLHKTIGQAELTSDGFKAFYEYLSSYLSKDTFVCFKEDTHQLMKLFDEMKFHIQIKRDRIVIQQGYLQDDYCKQLMDTFEEPYEEEHFYQNNPFGTIALSEMEEAVLHVLEKPYAQTFQTLEEYDKKYNDFIDKTLNEFELESQFYVAFRIYRENMKELNFHFCYPEIDNQRLRILECYDLALAKKNAAQKKEVIFNDCYLRQGEQFFVITGPNQGGKTTYARALGQILYFAGIGLMVPAKEAQLPTFDGIYTHFAAEESMDTGSGKLKEELNRLKLMMDSVTEHSFVIINEIFTSATSYDAYIMGKRVIDYFMEKACLGAYVTHIYELTKDDDRVVSLVASLLSEDSNIRTFKIERRLADGRSYANTIVEKYHMTYQEIKERIRK